MTSDLSEAFVITLASVNPMGLTLLLLEELVEISSESLNFIVRFLYRRRSAIIRNIVMIKVILFVVKQSVGV